MDAAKWDPRTRETADHSLPYLIAVALTDGVIDRESCAPERVVDPALRPLMNTISIREREEFTTRFPNEITSRLVVRLRNGDEVVRETSYPTGHRHNPVSDSALDAKFDAMIAGRPARDVELAGQLRERLWGFGDVKDVRDVMQPLAGLSAGNLTSETGERGGG
jgi:2-methylcitrate dehydratase